MIGRAALLLSMLVATVGCSPGESAADPAAEASNIGAALYRNEMEAVAAITRDTRIAMLERRIVALEAELATLRTNPEKLQLDVLAARLALVEQRALADPSEPLTPAAPPLARAPAADLRKAEAEAQRALERKRPRAMPD